MANTKTVSSLVTSIRQRADMEGSSFVSDSEIVDYINQSIAELHDLLINLFEDYYVESVSFSLPDGNPTTLPDGDPAGSNFPTKKGFYKALGVDVDCGGIKYNVPRYMFSERNAYNGIGGDVNGGLNIHYSIQGDKIRFIPESTASGTVTLWYAPEPQYFSGPSDTDTLSVKARHISRGYEEFIILDGAIKCLLKEESDVNVLIAQRELIRGRIKEAAATRDAASPMRISDVSTGSFRSGYVNWKI